MAQRFDVSETDRARWGREGLIKKCYSDNLNRGLWEIPAGQTIIKGSWDTTPRSPRTD